MPDLEGIDRLWIAWNEAGRTTGAKPLLWSEIQAFGQINGLTAQEQIILQHMSREYLDGLQLVSRLSDAPMDLDGQG